MSFPSNPVNGQTYNAPSGVIYKWDANKTCWYIPPPGTGGTYLSTVAVDGTTITGTGVPADPLVAHFTGNLMTPGAIGSIAHFYWPSANGFGNDMPAVFASTGPGGTKGAFSTYQEIGRAHV